MREIILVADKVLIEPAKEKDKTDAGLYLPQTVKEKAKVQTGKVIKTGPGYPIHDPSLLNEEPWLTKEKSKYFPLQARQGDYCIFLRDEAVEIEYEGRKYFVVPHAAILALIRESA